MDSEHVPIFVIDYILEQLIREKQGRQDYIEKRKPYFFYLLQSYNIYKYSTALFDEDFILKRSGILILTTDCDLLKKEAFLFSGKDKRNSHISGSLKIDYTKLYNIILVVYETFWHYDCQMLKDTIFSHLNPHIIRLARLAVDNRFNNYEITITKKSIAKDHLNMSEEWGWQYEINRHGGLGKRPTKEETMEIVKKKWITIKTKMLN